MKIEEVITVHPQTHDQLNALKAFMKALKIKFEIAKKSSYNPEFVEKVLQGEKDIEQGKGISFSMKELSDLCK